MKMTREEYKQYAPLQRVRLCDTVLVDVPMYNVAGLRIKVIKVVYNVLLDRYDEMELGSPQTTLAGAISQSTDISSQIQNALDQYTHQADASIYNAIQNATDLITGGLGGYVHIVRNANGKPIELVIADNEDLSQAINVWRWNQNGIGYSSTGYNGTFTTAWTIDGNFVADFITTGILNANLIRAGTISDDSGLNYWNLTSGQFVTKQGTIADLTINQSDIGYEGSDRKLQISRQGLFLGASALDNTRQAIQLHFNSLDFLERSDVSSWSLTEKADIDWYSNTLRIRSSGKIQFNTTGTAAYFINSTAVVLIQGTNPMLYVYGNFGARGTKSRIVGTDNYSDRSLFCYETPTPLFGDVGEAVLDEEGICYIDLDDIFTETIANRVEYQVFLQKEGEGDCWIAGKNPRYFVIQGTPGLRVAWELKAKQRDYETYRLELTDNGLEEYAAVNDDEIAIDQYIKEQEDLLYE